jgi:hypothetical protein
MLNVLEKKGFEVIQLSSVRRCTLITELHAPSSPALPSRPPNLTLGLLADAGTVESAVGLCSVDRTGRGGVRLVAAAALGRPRLKQARSYPCWGVGQTDGAPPQPTPLARPARCRHLSPVPAFPGKMQAGLRVTCAVDSQALMTPRTAPCVADGQNRVW